MWPAWHAMMMSVCLMMAWWAWSMVHDKGYGPAIAYGLRLCMYMTFVQTLYLIIWCVHSPRILFLHFSFWHGNLLFCIWLSVWAIFVFKIWCGILAGVSLYKIRKNNEKIKLCFTSNVFSRFFIFSRCRAPHIDNQSHCFFFRKVKNS